MDGCWALSLMENGRDIEVDNWLNVQSDQFLAGLDLLGSLKKPECYFLIKVAICFSVMNVVLFAV